MKVYEAVFNEDDQLGVYALSVVENPAMEDHWIALSEHKVEFAQVDEDKRLLIGAALIPNKKVYRNINGNEFYLTFSEETIEKLSHNFMKAQMNNNSSVEHETKVDGMSVVESWVVQDPANDKSNSFGKTYEKGTWVAMMKVDNDDVWSKVKNGEVKGFSIDAMLGMQEINLKTIDMNEEAKKSFLDELKGDIKALFNSQKNEVEEVKEVEKIEVQPEVEEAVEAAPEFDVDAFKAEVMSGVKDVIAQFTKESEKAIEAKDAELEEVKAELAKQPEAEETVVTPEPTKEKISLSKVGKVETMKDRVFENLANNFWNN